MLSYRPARTSNVRVALAAVCAAVVATGMAANALAVVDPTDHVELWYTTGSHQVRGLDTVTNTEINAYQGLTDLTGIAFADRDTILISQSGSSRGVTKFTATSPGAGSWTIG